ncbi:MAG: kinase/pyrophosphorylase [Proteobacteria bacterium]|nr:kinase/pyrophosphorylase [Pseudomonadota bacterium]
MPESASASEIFVLSDGTGETGTSAVRAVMLQFTNPWRLRVFGQVRTEAEAQRLMTQAAEARALVVFSLVNKNVADAVLRHAKKRSVPTVDLLGPLISNVAIHLKGEPRQQPGLLHGFSDDYFRRVEAVEFAVRHDDGANLRSLFEADLVLTGVSRTSKTPLSMYLAQRGYKTGNVPLVPGVEPPRELLELDPRKVFGLVIEPSVLLTVRQARVRALGAAPHSAYADADAIAQEVRRARRLFRSRGWRSLDVSGRAVEENASRILELYEPLLPGL